MFTTFRSYMANRRQVVSSGGAVSQPMLVKHDVPHDTVAIVLILFLAMIKEDLGFLSNTLMVADDTTISLYETLLRQSSWTLLNISGRQTLVRQQ